MLQVIIVWGILWEDLGLQNREEVFDSLIPCHIFSDRIIYCMKVISQKKITVVSKLYELVKKPTSKNQDSGFVSIHTDEIETISVVDSLKLIVLDRNDDPIVTRTMTYGELHKRLRVLPGNRSYHLLKY